MNIWHVLGVLELGGDEVLGSELGRSGLKS